MASRWRLFGLAALLGFTAMALVAGVDSLVAYAGGSDDLVWGVGIPVTLTAAVASSAWWTWERTDGAWAATIAAALLPLVTAAVGWYILMLIVTSVHPVMVGPGPSVTRGMPPAL